MKAMTIAASKIATSMAAALLASGSAAFAADKPPQPRQCEHPIQRVATPAVPARFEPGQRAAMKLRAVELRVGTCSVLLAANGTVFEAPAFVDRPATIAPAR